MSSSLPSAPFSKTRLVGALALVTLACFALWWSKGAVSGMVGLPVIAARLTVMSREERCRPISEKELIAIVASLLVMVVLLVLLHSPATPESTADDERYRHSISQPRVVVPVWLFLCYCVYGIWQKAQTVKAAESVEKQPL